MPSIETSALVCGSSAARALEHVERLCDLGDRFAGQAGDKPAADYIEHSFRKLRLEIERTPVPLVTFREDECLLILDDGSPLDAISAYYSPSTHGALRAPLVRIGDGTEPNYATTDVKGSIVVLEEDSLGYELFWLGTLAERAAAHGAVGLVVIHPFPWSYRMTMEFGRLDLSKRFAEPSLASVAVSANSGMRLLEAMASRRAMASFELRTQVGPCTSDHVAGILRGTRYPEELIVVLAHRDSPIPPGANDNGSGTATILEIAELLSGHELERSVVFLSLAGEEGRAEGAAKYLEGLGEDTPKICAAISIDMIAAGGPLRLVDTIHWPDRPQTHSFTTWLMETLEQAATGLGYQLERYCTESGADAGRFLDAGVPTAWLWKPDDFRYHSPEDTPNNLDANAIKAAAEIVATTVVHIANGRAGNGVG